jgi:hypothetical protein
MSTLKIQLTDGTEVELTEKEQEVIGFFLTSDYGSNDEHTTVWTWDICDGSKSIAAVLGSLIKKGVCNQWDHEGRGRKADFVAGFTDEAKPAIRQHFIEKKVENSSQEEEGSSVSGGEPDTRQSQSDTGDTQMTVNKKLVGTSIAVLGYGSVAGKEETVKIVGMDATHVTLRFGTDEDPADVRFKISDGKAVGADASTGYEIPEATLKSMVAKPAAKAAAKTSASSTQPGDTKMSTTAPATAKKTTVAKAGTTKTQPAAAETKKPAAAAKTTAKTETAKTEAPARTRRELRTPLAKFPNELGKDQIELRVADRGYFALCELSFFKPNAKKDSDAEKAFKAEWNNAADKGWIFVRLSKANAQHLFNAIPALNEELSGMGNKGAGVKRTLANAIEAPIVNKFNFKRPKAQAESGTKGGTVTAKKTTAK